VALFPPGIPLTLHITLVFVAFVTCAANDWVSPSNTVLAPGVTVTIMEGGGDGGGGPELAPPPPQPSKLTPAAVRSAAPRQKESNFRICRRGRTGMAIADGWPGFDLPHGCLCKLFICNMMHEIRVRLCSTNQLFQVPIWNSLDLPKFQFGVSSSSRFFFTSLFPYFITFFLNLGPRHGVWQMDAARTYPSRGAAESMECRS
jgi:hypothetical protein